MEIMAQWNNLAVLCKWRRPNIVENTTTNPSMPSCFSLMSGTKMRNLSLSGFKLHFGGIPAHLIFSLCYFAPLPISARSGPSGSIALYLSFQFPALSHPSVLPPPLSQLALGLGTGGLFALEDHDGLHHFLHWDFIFCCALFILVTTYKWGNGN